MLVLSRKVLQSVLIGESILVTVLSVEGKRVKLGVEAPLAVKVWRSELRPEHTACLVGNRLKPA